jgi:hypothetical protein
MAGFRPEPKQYRLKFIDDEDLAGLEVVMGSVTVGEYNEMLKLALSDAMDADSLDAGDKLLDMFAGRIVSWNLEDFKTGKKTPTTPAGVRSVERSIITRVIAAWQIAIVGVSSPLNGSSSSGETSLERSLGLASKSPSQ